MPVAIADLDWRAARFTTGTVTPKQWSDYQNADGIVASWTLKHMARTPGGCGLGVAGFGVGGVTLPAHWEQRNCPSPQGTVGAPAFSSSSGPGRLAAGLLGLGSFDPEGASSTGGRW